MKKKKENKVIISYILMFVIGIIGATLIFNILSFSLNIPGVGLGAGICNPEETPCGDECCSSGDYCIDGVCVPYCPPECDPVGCICPPDPCETIFCEDNGNQCDGPEHCLNGECVSGPSLNCDDGDPCTADSCDPLSGCVNEYDETLGEECCMTPPDCGSVCMEQGSGSDGCGNDCECDPCISMEKDLEEIKNK